MSLGIFSPIKTIGEIPRYISAASASGLERLMLKTQLRLKGTFNWMAIQYNAIETKWFAWYLIDIEYDERSKENQKAIDNES